MSPIRLEVYYQKSKILDRTGEQVNYVAPSIFFPGLLAVHSAKDNPDQNSGELSVCLSQTEEPNPSINPAEIGNITEGAPAIFSAFTPFGIGRVVFSYIPKK